MWYKKLHNQIFVGILIGVALGFLLPPQLAINIGFIGDLFVAALKMLIAPLILTSIFIGITSLGDVRKLGSLGKQTVIYYLSTTLIAVLIGVIIVNIIDPGKGTVIKPEPVYYKQAADLLKENDFNLESIAKHNEIAKSILLRYQSKPSWPGIKYESNNKHTQKILINKQLMDQLKVELENRAALSPEKAKQIVLYTQNYIKILDVIANLKKRGVKITDDEVKKTISTIQTKVSLGKAFIGLIKKMLVNPFQALSEGNAIGIIFFALLFGAFATVIGPKGEPIIRFMGGFNDVMFKIVDLVIKIAPIGVLSLITKIIGENSGSPEQLSQLAQNVGWYMATVLGGLFIHGLIVLPLILWFFGRMSPLQFFKGMRSPLLTAFSTSTSGGTLPLTFKATQVNLGLPKRVTEFVLPLGATMNMDGTALYEAVAVIFIANFLGIDLSMIQQITIFITASIAAIGAAAIPSAGLVTMTIVLSAVGLPTSGIVIILAVDRILDMFRTAINVEGDAVGSVVISRFQQDNSQK